MGLLEKISNFNKKKIMVVGDLMLDKYIWGSVSRISPEAPVQVVDVHKQTFTPGGASNVASNAAGLGAKTFLAGITGTDQEAKILSREIKKRNISAEGILADPNRTTTTKTRIMGKHQQLLRIDHEEKNKLSSTLKNSLISHIKKNIGTCDAIIISDYAKGVISPEIAKEIIKSKAPVVVDPKPKNIAFYKKASLITPNHKEANEMAGVESEHDFIKAGKTLQKKLDSSIIITRGERGMAVFEKNKKPLSIKAEQKEVFDVTGAGDTVAAVLALSLASGMSIQESAVMANIAAGIKVEKLGTATVSPEELKEELSR